MSRNRRWVADASSTLEEAEETAWNEIEEYLKAINPYDLQKLVAALLRAMGYHCRTDTSDTVFVGSTGSSGN